MVGPLLGMLPGDKQVPQAVGPRDTSSPARLGAIGDVMKPTSFSIPVFSFRRIETPYERRLGYKNFVAVIDARHLPDLADWRDINVRDAKLRGRVPNAIRKTFAEEADEFLFMNRGLVIAAEKVDYKEGAGEK